MEYPKKVISVLLSLCAFIILFITCTDQQAHQPKAEMDERYAGFAGSASCSGCHQKVYASHIQTAHYRTSRKTDSTNVLGSILPGKNQFSYSPLVSVNVEKRNNTYLQVEYVNGKEKASRPMDITIGSGKRGQTFIYWNQYKLFQLPLTYFTSLDQWTNSPGYANRIVFRRPVTSRCMECHSTYFQKFPDDNTGVESFSPKNIVYGVDCESCHGPGAKHVAYHVQHPKETKANFILNPARFNRTQQLDMCRLCHGGRLSKSKPSFSFVPGEPLGNYFLTDSVVKNISEMDVHGNQYGMLAQSKCFKMSKMTCNTCHQPHENEAGKLTVFSQRCINCHKELHTVNCKYARSAADAKNKVNCIDCHMPEQSSRAIMVLLQGQTIPTAASMRSHYISIYKGLEKIGQADHMK